MLSAVVEMCEGALSIAWLDNYESIRKEWEPDSPISGSGSIPLDGFAAALGISAFDMGGAGEKRCGLVSCSRDGRVSGPARFTSEDLRSLSADQVLAYDPNTGESHAVAIDTFIASACEQ